MSDSRQQIGRAAEDAAAALLTSHGLATVTRNYRCRGGEIDLIMRDGDTLVFVEVRFRRSQRFGGALGSVTASKQRRIVFAARHYLQSANWPGPCRFDVVGVADASPPEWIRDAFQT